MSTKRVSLLILMATASVSGCANRPGWGIPGFGQGTVDRQSARAVYHDPYPLNDIGPEVVGGRPREYAQPMPEATRNQRYYSSGLSNFYGSLQQQ
jgi:hypothetical protein